MSRSTKDAKCLAVKTVQESGKGEKVIRLTEGSQTQVNMKRLTRLAGVARATKHIPRVKLTQLADAAAEQRKNKPG